MGMTKIKNNMMQLLVNSMPGIVFWKSLDLKYLGANQKCLQFLDLENQKQLIGKTDSELLCSHQKQEYLSKYDFLVLQTEQAYYNIEDSFLQVDGSMITLLTDKHPLYDDEHNLIGVLCLSSIEDDQNSNVQTYLENIIASVPYYIFWKNSHSVYLGCNKKFSSLVDKTPQEVIGKTDEELGWKEGESYEFIAGDKEVMSGNSRVNVEETLLQPDGSETIMLVSKVPVFDKNERCIGILGVSIDITERKHMEQELIFAKNAAESANHAKTEFIANMSHDIRTPLSGVVSMSKMMENKTSDPEEKQYAHWVNESGEQLLGLLNGILDVIAADNINDSDLQQENFDLHRCIQDIARLEMPTIKMKNLDLQITIPDNIPKYLISDRTKIHRIMLNLLGNAIKFTPNGHVGIGVRLIEQLNDTVRLEFSISDTGIGIPQELQSSVFDRFFRINPSAKGVYKGHGIGLHIAQSYVELLGGEIKLKSAVNEGTTFYFELLLKTGADEEDHSYDQLPANPDKITPSYPAPGSTITNKDSPRLLLVEDNPIALQTIQLLATQAGYRYTSVDNAERAFQLIQQTHFDLILTDVGLPGISGIELAQTIRAWEQSGNRKPLLIAGLTAHTGKEHAEKCLQSGMNKVIVKPASLAMIQNLVHELISSQQSALVLNEPENIYKPDTAGFELPATDEELFKLDQFPILDVENGLRILGSREMLKEMLILMLKEGIDQDKLAIEQAHAQHDWHTIELLIHKMKGGAAYCGTIKMHRACQYLERYQQAGFSELLEPLYNQFLRVVAETKIFLTHWLASEDNKLSQ